MAKDPNETPMDKKPAGGPEPADNVVDLNPLSADGKSAEPDGGASGEPEILSPAASREAESTRIRRRQMRNQSLAAQAGPHELPTQLDDEFRGIIPRCSESLLALGLITIAVWGCWLLYEPFLIYMWSQLLEMWSQLLPAR